MTTFARRQQLLDLIRKQPGIRVPDIAKTLSVSEGTVRNDLRALAQAGQLTRVRGGAVVTAPAQPVSAAFLAKSRIQAEAKQCMARCAAELVQHGDSILCDASTTVYYLAPYLQECRNLTVITNGVEIARSLAQNPSHSVILLGGSLRADGASVTGPLSERVLEDLHFKTAFLSATALSLERGLYEVDINEAQLKRKMIAAAQSVVALVDSAKFGQLDLTPFARLDQVSRLLTDDGLDRKWIEQLQQAGIPLTICGPDSMEVYP